VPHAGHVCSGPVAGSAYARLATRVGRICRVVLLGPAHRVAVRGWAAPALDTFETPLGRVRIDSEARDALASLPQVGESGASEVAEVIERLWGGDETLIVGLATDIDPHAVDLRLQRYRVRSFEDRPTGHEGTLQCARVMLRTVPCARPCGGTGWTTGACSAACARAAAGCTTASAGCASCGRDEATPWCSPRAYHPWPQFGLLHRPDREEADALIRRDWHDIELYGLDAQGACPRCGTALAGRFGAAAERFGRRRIPLQMAV